MAEANISVAQDQLRCPVCLELLNDPVTTSCGHSFCMVCINKCWDQEDDKGTYSCPQCRETFTPRPAVSKNITLAEVVEKLKAAEPQASQLIFCAGPEDVGCDFCTGRTYKAVKSCLVCLASFCEAHLQPHYQVPVYKKHKLIKASRSLQDQICSQHDKLLEVYCRTDQQCICMMCTMDDHKGHDTISAAAVKKEKQKWEEIQKESKQRIQSREEEIQKLRSFVESHTSSAQTAMTYIEKICTELKMSIERRCSEASDLIESQEKDAVHQAEEAIKEIEQEVEELKKRNGDLEGLLNSEDPFHFFQTSPAHSVSAGPTESPSITASSLLTYEIVTTCMSQLREKIEELCKVENKKVSCEVGKIWINSAPEPQTQQDFLHNFCRFTLDPNTVNKNLRLSEENTVVTCSGTDQWYHDHPDRFNHLYQVLSRESVSGRCYWEVEWSGNDGVYIAVSYKSISRKGRGDECWFGCNDQSWSLFLSPSRFSFLHNNKRTKIPIMPSSSRIGVYVDHRAGSLSFYNVSDTMKLLHRVQTTFTQPLYPGFLVCKGSTVNCHPEMG